MKPTVPKTLPYHGRRIGIASLLLVALSFCLTARGQRRNGLYEDYIQKYKGIAVSEMKRYGIPASITLAQGLLESGAGQGTLARRSNNHFGIKCGGDWTGRTVTHTDDAPNECFRAYKHPRESYEDHSRFLRGRSRYAALFKLKTTDYKGWAHGLKKAGYATDPRYAYRLIGIIEQYGLYRYDTKKGTDKWIEPHQPYLSNGLLYVVARTGDTQKQIAREFDISRRKLRKYNDLYKGYEPEEGDILYLERKRRKADREHTTHVVQGGESMHAVSQRYGIRLKNLYKLNRMKPGDPAPTAGTRLRLR